MGILFWIVLRPRSGGPKGLQHCKQGAMFKFKVALPTHVEIVNILLFHTVWSVLCREARLHVFIILWVSRWAFSFPNVPWDAPPALHRCRSSCRNPRNETSLHLLQQRSHTVSKSSSVSQKPLDRWLCTSSSWCSMYFISQKLPRVEGALLLKIHLRILKE